MKEIKAYQCGFCKKYGKYKGNIVAHEKKCFHNPNTRSCATCFFLIQESIKVEDRVCPFTDSIPVCTAGYTISSFEGENKKVNMRTECGSWMKKDIELLTNF